MRRFLITIGRVRHAPRISQEVYAENAQRAGEQADDLRESVDERVVVTPVPSEAEKLAADVQYLRDQRARERRRIAETAALEQSYHQRRGWLL